MPLFSLFSILVVCGSFFAGYLTGKKQINHWKYDYSLFELSNYILIYDALEAERMDEIFPLITANINSSFNQVVTLYKYEKFDDFERARCATSRRFRSFRESGKPEFSDAALMEQGFYLEDIKEYLASECLGPPSHSNWMTSDQAK